MLKSVLYYLLMVTTAVRFVDMIYLLSRESTNLPVLVIALTGAMILYGIVLVAKKFTSSIRLKELMLFYGVQAVLISVNLITVAAFVPLQLTLTETFLVGSFLDLLIDGCCLYACAKQIRSSYQPFVRVVGNERA